MNTYSHHDMQSQQSQQGSQIDCIEHFNEHAHSWWDESGPLKTLHQINPVRLAWILQSINPGLVLNLKGQRILDIGCGGGILTESLAKQGANILGIDLAAELIEVAKLHLLEQQLEEKLSTQNNSSNHLLKYSELNIDYQCIDLNQHANACLASGQLYDMITCMEMLEHVDEPAQIIVDAARILKPNGLFFASTINQSHEAYFKAIIAAEYILKLVPKYTHFYHQFIKPSALNQMAKAAGLQAFAIKGLSYQPFCKPYARVSDDVNVGYMMAFRKK
jgi:2-polyprenyl-6-hydroxyphenyl methylase / 3-demethylubiquinone-9 3-methyltransferase